MRLSWMRMYEGSPKKMQAETLRQQQMSFPNVVKEIHAALKSGYEITFIKNDKITLLKYNKKEDDYFILTIEGAEKEILDIQLIFRP